ncbi:MAG: hypothetical protein JXQ99_21170 [Hyphomicrobiaceae bacterium]
MDYETWLTHDYETFEVKEMSFWHIIHTIDRIDRWLHDANERRRFKRNELRNWLRRFRREVEARKICVRDGVISQEHAALYASRRTRDQDTDDFFEKLREHYRAAK